MLLLTRKRGEEIMIGDDICIKVLHQDGEKVCIGIRAPDEVSVHRREIYQRIQLGIPQVKKTNIVYKRASLSVH